MITFDRGDKRFNYRVGGVAVHAGRVLLQFITPGDFWILPGGRPELGEPAAAALQREIREEMGVEAEVGRLVWMAENFFNHEAKAYHELVLFFDLTFPPGSAPLSQVSFASREGDQECLCQWHPVETLERLPLYPAFLRAGLRSLPTQTQHIVIDELESSARP